MDYKVEFKGSFLDDLERIVETISEENAKAARKLGERIVSMADDLVFFPERHPRVRQRPWLRRYVVAGHYKVFYRIREDVMKVEILRCWDGKRGSEPGVVREEQASSAVGM